MNKPKAIGTFTESAVVTYLRANGWPYAERRSLRGSGDAGDVTGTPGVCWSVKGGKAAQTASDKRVEKWLADAETQRYNADATVAVLVMKRAGIGKERAGEWWAVMRAAYVIPEDALGHPDISTAPVRLHLETACRLLRVFGYGEPKEKP